MEGILSSMDSFQLLRVLSFTPMMEFPTEGNYVRVALFFSALVFCFWGWWRKYTQSLFLLFSSSCFSFKFNTSSHQIHVSRVPAVMFAVDQVSHVNDSTGKRGKIYMRFECSIQSPEDEFCRQSEAVDRDNSVTSFFPSTEEEKLRDGRDLQEKLGSGLRKEIVNCFDVSWRRREILAGSRVEYSDNTVRLWDIPTSRSVNCMKLHETSVIAAARFSNSRHVNLVSGIGIGAEQKSTLYVWDSRNFPKPLSFSLGKKWRMDIVEFNDKKVCVCDDWSERVFDLRMGGAGVVEVNRRPSLQDFGLCTSSSLLQ